MVFSYFSVGELASSDAIEVTRLVGHDAFEAALRVRFPPDPPTTTGDPTAAAAPSNAAASAAAAARFEALPLASADKIAAMGTAAFLPLLGVVAWTPSAAAPRAPDPPAGAESSVSPGIRCTTWSEMLYK